MPSWKEDLVPDFFPGPRPRHLRGLKIMWYGDQKFFGPRFFFAGSRPSPIFFAGPDFVPIRIIFFLRPIHISVF